MTHVSEILAPWSLPIWGAGTLALALIDWTIDPTST